MPIKLPNGKIARTIAEQVYKNMKDIAFLMNKKDFQILVVEELPEEGSENTLYLVPSDDPEQGNVYTEYIWTGTAFEMVGTTAIDISNMVTTDTNQNIIGEKTFENPVTFYSNITLNVDAAFEGDVLPTSTDSYDLGSDTYAWHDFYMQGLLKIKSAVNTFELKNAGYYIEMKEGSTVLCSWGSGGLAVGTSIYPNAANKDLGQAANKWKDFYMSGVAYIPQIDGTSELRFSIGGNKRYYMTDGAVFAGNDNLKDLGRSGNRWKDVYVSGHLKDGLGNDATMEELVGIGKALTGQLQPNAVTLADGDTLTDAATIQIMFLHLPIKVNGLMFYFIREANNKYCYFSYEIDASNNYTPKRLFIDKSTYLVGYHTI